LSTRPTNDLDVDTLRALEDGLLEFAGCAVVISQIGGFLDRIATHILAFEDEGRAVWFEATTPTTRWTGSGDWGADAERPQPAPYKKI